VTTDGRDTGAGFGVTTRDRDSGAGFKVTTGDGDTGALVLDCGMAPVAGWRVGRPGTRMTGSPALHCFNSAGVNCFPGIP
jgi:hypothetical protein